VSDASPYERFRRSMDIGFEEWHDGIGYDLDALAEASPEDRTAIETLLVPRAGNDWRDIEALAALGTPRADRALADAFATAGPEIRVAILRDAPHVIPADRVDAELVRLVDECDLGLGMTHVLTLVEDLHPPAVVDALLRGTLDEHRSVPVHYAAMLLYLHGQAAEPFDWEVRPFVLRFADSGPDERQAAYRELCERIGR
jgi:hypothetical protein